MKALLLFSVAAGLAFAGGYGAGRYELAARAAAPPADGAQEAEEPAGRAGEDGAAGPYYVEAGQFVVPVLAQGRTEAFILAQVTLEAGDGEGADLVRRRLPHARSAMLEGLFGLAQSGAFDGPAVDPAAVAGALRASANGQFSAGPVKAVLIDRLLRQDNSRR
ncbi:hypothetical protein [Azospirillum sp. ST 5-10]|uniref:hypothetical protein n=1 Tax=unclassified Azospirillum TaxID=2630922 RepID=UPI003F49FB74